MKYKYLLILVLISLQLVNSRIIESCTCGKSNLSGLGRVINGRVYTPHKYPWLVAILINHIVFCGGSIISNKHVLTAGHCVNNEYARRGLLKVSVGAHDIRDSGRIFDIKHFDLSPYFVSKSNYDDGDIAVITIVGTIPFNRNQIPVCLPKTDEYLDIKSRAILAGWGYLKENATIDSLTDIPFETRITALQISECVTVPLLKRIINKEQMFCGIGRDTDACQGDSGGPLFKETKFNRYEQFGVISFGAGCNRPNMPGVYARVTACLNWIRDFIQKDDADVCSDS